MNEKLFFPKISGIYCYENKINKKKYIGLAINLYIRISNHERNFKRNNFDETNCGESKILWNAIKKYKRESFTVYVIEECAIEKLEERETYYIKELGSHISENGYNVLWGGFSRIGTRHTDESKLKMSKNNGKGFFGKHHDEKTKKMMSKLKKGIPLSDSHKRKIKENHVKTFLGKKHSEESRKKMSEYHSNKILSEETKEKISKANTGKKKTQEELAKRSVTKIKNGLKELDSTSEYYGIYFDKNWGKWRIQIRENGKYTRLGSHDLEIEAAKIYDRYVFENNLPNPLNFPENYPNRGV